MPWETWEGWTLQDARTVTDRVLSDAQMEWAERHLNTWLGMDLRDVAMHQAELRNAQQALSWYAAYRHDVELSTDSGGALPGTTPQYTQASVGDVTYTLAAPAPLPGTSTAGMLQADALREAERWLRRSGLKARTSMGQSSQLRLAEPPVINDI